ncbi:hypothetical protein [Streptomyces sp. DH12]|uniref:hypothetical protein n=1 Tax=Streptomyces sp. DH12 TaxID=2857010 RepID=UPI001E5B941D|nr:hypothetical protein [Streptomyces sp. DH12]
MRRKGGPARLRLGRPASFQGAVDGVRLVAQAAGAVLVDAVPAAPRLVLLRRMAVRSALAARNEAPDELRPALERYDVAVFSRS